MQQQRRRKAVGVLTGLILAGCVASPEGFDEISGEDQALVISGVTLQTTVVPRFLGATNNGGSTVVATATTAQAWETFKLDDVNGGALESGDAVFIQAGGGQYFQAVNGGGSTLNAASASKLGWETFKIVKKSGTGVIKNGDVVGLQASTGTWVSAKNGGGAAVVASGAGFGTWEELKVAGLAVVAPPSGDPTCSTGIASGTACCPAACGACGGTACGSRPGGSDACCTGPILAAAVSCSGSKPPCVLSTTDGSGGSTGTGGTSGSGGSVGTGGSGGSTGPTGFVHPGVLVNKAMLDFVKAKVAAGQAPWAAALNKAKSSGPGSLSYTPHARATVECGSYSNPDIGCSDEKNDVQAAYAHALLWYHTGNKSYASKAIQILDAYSGTIKSHTNANAPLQAAWVAETFVRAAEIIRYSGAGWSDTNAQRFGTMLKNVYLPLIVNGSSSNGNWETSMIEAVINIGVYNDDKVTFDKGVKMWRERVPAYIYLAKDGATPVPPPRGGKNSYSALVGFWYNQTTFVDGLMQETCRDFSHSQYGLAAIINAAETARIQGVDLYAAEGERIRKAMEFHAKYINGAAAPSWLCGGKLTDVYGAPMWEIGYNQFATYGGASMPSTLALVNRLRPTGADHHMAWETLTHANLGAVGRK